MSLILFIKIKQMMNYLDDNAYVNIRCVLALTVKNTATVLAIKSHHKAAINAAALRAATESVRHSELQLATQQMLMRYSLQPKYCLFVCLF